MDAIKSSFLSAPFLATLFNPDPTVVTIASQYLWLVPVSYGTAGLMQVTSSAFNAMGKPVPSITITATHMVGCYIPMAYLGGRIAGPLGIFVAASVANLLVGSGAYIWSQRTCLQRTAVAQN
ncbi:MAG: MATE family efflux transporter [Cyanobacteria bacterium J06649_12]